MELVQVTMREANAPRPFDYRFEWMDQASCKGLTNIFFPGRGDTSAVKLAELICSQCPVQQQCLEYAIRNIEFIGIWGGMSERKRRIMRRQMRKELGD